MVNWWFSNPLLFLGLGTPVKLLRTEMKADLSLFYDLIIFQSEVFWAIIMLNAGVELFAISALCLFRDPHEGYLTTVWSLHIMRLGLWNFQRHVCLISFLLSQTSLFACVHPSFCIFVWLIGIFLSKTQALLLICCHPMMFLKKKEKKNYYWILGFNTQWSSLVVFI